MAQDFKQLVHEVTSCRRCVDELPLGPNPVIQCHPRARILIVGQAPGRRVHETNIPFNDPSGVRLRDWMGVSAGTFYDEREIALLPMAFCFPGTGSNGDLPPPAVCAETWRGRLLSALNRIELTIIIGRYAIDWHMRDLNNAPVAEIVKRWAEYLPEKIVLPHPSPRNNRWLKNYPWFETDCVPQLKTRIGEILGSEKRSPTAKN